MAESQPEIERDVLEHKPPAILTGQKKGTFPRKSRGLDSIKDFIAVRSEGHAMPNRRGTKKAKR